MSVTCWSVIGCAPSPRQVRHCLVGASGDCDTAQVLIADQRKIRRIDDRAKLAICRVRISIGWPAFTACPVASCAESTIGLKPMLGVGWQCCHIGRRIPPGEIARVPPLLDDASAPTL